MLQRPAVAGNNPEESGSPLLPLPLPEGQLLDEMKSVEALEQLITRS